MQDTGQDWRRMQGVKNSLARLIVPLVAGSLVVAGVEGVLFP